VCDADSLTYGALNRRVEQVAWALRERGVTRGVRVAVAMPRSLDLLVVRWLEDVPPVPAIGRAGTP
jgi:non-ribosomal peptide synthetase component F